MTVWLDAQLPPSLAGWMRDQLGVVVEHVRELGLRDATDVRIFEAARAADAIVMTKDTDFVRLLEQRGAPPRIILLTCGNTSNARLREVLTATWSNAVRLLGAGEQLVEIGDK